MTEQQLIDRITFADDILVCSCFEETIKEIDAERSEEVLSDSIQTIYFLLDHGYSVKEIYRTLKQCRAI